MRRITLALLVMFAFFGNNAHAQLEVVFSGNPVVQPNGQVSVDVSVNNFDNLFGVQFSMNWDSLVLQYNSVTNIVPNSTLPDVSSASVGNPSAAGVDPGQATFSWFPFDGSGKTIPDGTVLFTLVFDGVGAPCTSTSILISDDPRVIEVSVDDGNNTDIGAISSGIALEIDCGMMMDCGPNNGNPSCGTGTPGGLGIIGSDELVPSGTNVCMEITVDNFSDIQSAEMNVIWDASLLNYTGTQNYCTDVAGFGASNFFFIGNNLANDTLRFVWFDFNANMPATLADDKVLFEVCFDAVGPNGSYADVMFLDTEFGDSNQNQVDHYTDCGSVEICVPIIDPGMITLYTEDIEVMQGDDICVPVYADGFTDVQSFQFTMDWVDAVLSYSSIQNINPALDPSPLGAPANGLLPLNWFANSGVTLADGSLLFEVCFDFVGVCTDNALNSSFISFIDQPSFNIEFGNSNDQLIEPVVTTGANVSVQCPDCDVSLDVSNPDCIGETGTIFVTGGAMPYMGCVWEYNNSPFNPGGCNVFAGLTGNYSVTVTDANNVECILTASLINPTPISFTPVVSDISCAGDGTVNVPVANISGGTGPYMVNYSPQGPYSVATSVTITVTDSNQCTQTQSVSVGNTVTGMVVNSTSSTGSCSNDTGEITITFSGGCPPYSTTGGVNTGNVIILSDLIPGDYTPVISDSQGNMISVGPVNVPSFDTPTGTAMTTPATNGGTDGSITLNIMGGIMPYTTTINPAGGTPTTDGYSGLAPGEYTVTVTDDNGCMLVLSGIIVEELPDLSDTILVDITILSAAEFNGFGVSCNGECDGAISTVISGVNGSLVSILINGEASTLEDLDAGDLCAGMYTVVVEDEQGLTGEATFQITEPIQLVVDMFAVECDSIGVENTGSIDMAVSGGVSDYTYTWSSGQDTQDITSVSAGTYTLMVEDANGCLDIENVVVVPFCDSMVIGQCYNANNIITPGASAGANDFLNINCASSNPNNLNVYDRWGRLVHTAANYNNTWNGVDMAGNDLGEGTYYWVMDVTFVTGETRLFKGYVTILRDL